MSFNHVVPIPKIKGKIVFRKVNETVYVEYEIRRVYDKNRKYNKPERVRIGVRIRERPDLMLANENYFTYFPKGEETMSTEEKASTENYETEREYRFTLREFFDQLFYEFQKMSRKNPEGIVNENKVKRLNSVLQPLLEMLKDEEYAQFLELIPEPETQETKEGQTIITGMSYGDIALLMTQFKSALTRYFQKRR
ncbi:MAG: hypothetical protein IJI09_12560 [Clostridia bacterium]|nr:hypothetical protein [Clostridia bacterium]